jgi:hypothetical protein
MSQKNVPFATARTGKDSRRPWRAVARNIPIKNVGCGATALVALALAIAPYRGFSDNTLSELSFLRNAANQEQYCFESNNSLLPSWLP